jgi:tetratricopeptide (TPR) repeat protein
MRATHAHPLRTARCQRNLTIEQLAQEARVGASTVWRAEHHHPINAESRRRLCAYFDMTSQDLGLVGDSQEQRSPQPTQPMNLTAPQAEEALAFLMKLRSARTGASEQTETSSEAHICGWLARVTSDLASLLGEGWTLHTMLDSLQVILQGVQRMPASVQHTLLQAGAGAMMNRMLPPTGEHLSLEERTRLCNALRKFVAEGWQLFHTAGPAYVLVVAQAQLYLLQQAQSLIYPDLRYSLYAALYNLIGAAHFFQGCYATAQHAHEKAHIAALEGADTWNMTQSLNWQAIDSNGCGYYAEAIQFIEAALRLLDGKNDEAYLRLRAHLLADWAYNASLLQEQGLAQQKLEASAAALGGLGPHEEFDLVRWHQMAGSCLLAHGKYSTAIDHLEQSLAQLPQQWLARRILTLVPLAEAYARQRERDASIATAEHAVSLLHALDSTMLSQRFMEYQRVLIESFPHDQHVRAFISSAQQPLMLK